MKAIRACISFVLVFAALGLSSSAWAGQVLPPEVGQRLQRALESGELAPALRSTWHLDDLQVRPNKIHIKIKEEGGMLGVQLLSLDAGQGEAGRWFRIRPEGPEPGSAKWVALGELGRRVDALFDESPWKTARKEMLARMDGQERQARHGMAGKGFYLGLGAFQWLLLTLAFAGGAWSLRKP